MEALLPVMISPEYNQKRLWCYERRYGHRPTNHSMWSYWSARKPPPISNIVVISIFVHFSKFSGPTVHSPMLSSQSAAFHRFLYSVIPFCSLSPSISTSYPTSSTSSSLSHSSRSFQMFCFILSHPPPALFPLCPSLLHPLNYFTSPSLARPRQTCHASVTLFYLSSGLAPNQ